MRPISYILPEESAKKFYQDMTTIDQENQKKINAFFDKIKKDIFLEETPDGKILVDAKNLDAEKILSILEKEK